MAIVLRVITTTDSAPADVLCVHASNAPYMVHSRQKAVTNPVKEATSLAQDIIAKAATSNEMEVTNPAKEVTNPAKEATSPVQDTIVKEATSLVPDITVKMAINPVLAIIARVKDTPQRTEPEEAIVPVPQATILMQSTA